MGDVPHKKLKLSTDDVESEESSNSDVSYDNEIGGENDESEISVDALDKSENEDWDMEDNESGNETSLGICDVDDVWDLEDETDIVNTTASLHGEDELEPDGEDVLWEDEVLHDDISETEFTNASLHEENELETGGEDILWEDEVLDDDIGVRELEDKPEIDEIAFGDVSKGKHKANIQTSHDEICNSKANNLNNSNPNNIVRLSGPAIVNVEATFNKYRELTTRKSTIEKKFGPSQFHLWGRINDFKNKSITLANLIKEKDIQNLSKPKEIVDNILQELQIDYSILELPSFKDEQKVSVGYDIKSVPAFSFCGSDTTQQLAIEEAATKCLEFFITLCK